MQTKLLRILFVALLGVMGWSAQAQNPGTTCMPPTVISSIPDSNKITINWVSNMLPTIPYTYAVEYTPYPATSSSVWVSGTSLTSSYTAMGLAKCTNYVFRVKTNCSATSSSAWGATIISKTTGCVVVPVCTAPTITTISSTNNSATLSWGSAQTPSYTVEYTAAPLSNSSVWTAVNSTSLSTTISGLASCKVYIYRVKANCSATNSSAWSTLRENKTTGCVVVTPCASPTLSLTSTDSTKATLAWGTGTVPTTGTTYTVEYTVLPTSSTSTWSSVTATASPFTVTGLTTCKEYAFRVKANCSPTSSSASSNIVTGKTKGCVVVVPCTTPSIGTITTDTTKATFSWGNGSVPTAGTTYTVEYTAAPQTNTSVWTSVTTTTTSITITGLTACKGYFFRVKANCSPTTSSTWSAVRDAKTKGCTVAPPPCTAPVMTTVTTDTTTATINWAAGAAGTTYIVEYTTSPISATSVWLSVTSSTNSKTITGLTACTVYMFRVKAVCSATSSSSWSANRDAKTKGCAVTPPPCTTPVMTTISTDTTTATINWTAGAVGTTYTIEYTVAPQTNTSVWTAVTSTTNSVTISGLTACTGYLFRVKANCSATSSSAWSAVRDSKTKGCVVVTPCIAPAITSIASDSTKATISWVSPGVVGAGSYTLEYTAAPLTSTSTWTAVTSTTPTATVTGLTPCTGYFFRVKANCSPTSSSAWSPNRDTKTKGCVVPSCTKPTSLNNAATNTSATLSWTGTGAYFQVRYKAFPGNTNWVVKDSLTANTATINSLKKCTRYIWQVRSRCSNNSWTSWSDYKVFTTTGCTSTQSLSVSPNPGSNLNIYYTLPSEGKVSIDIMNIQGSLVRTFEVGTQYAGDNQFNTEDMDIQAGIYLIVMKVNGVQQQVQRWIKE